MVYISISFVWWHVIDIHKTSLNFVTAVYGTVNEVNLIKYLYNVRFYYLRRQILRTVNMTVINE